VLQWAEGALSLAGFFMLVLLSNAAFFGFLAFTRMGGMYFEAASVAQSRASPWGRWDWFRRRRKVFSYPLGPLEKFFNLFHWMDTDTRALLVKDARMFWRDTTQWGQLVLFFGLLAVYVINLRQFTSQLTNPFWLHLVSFLNLGACSLNLAMLTTRFGYPQFSLEGRRLWIIGMTPMGLARVVKTKYCLASCASLIVTLGLVVLSSTLLKLDWDPRGFFCGGDCGDDVQFERASPPDWAFFIPNFKENNPSKIVSGFGGTFCFVLSFLYILLSVIMLGLWLAETNVHWPVELLLVASVGVFLLLSFVVGWVPMKLGLRHLKNFEF